MERQNRLSFELQPGLGQKLRARRLALNLKQREVAAKARVTESYISQIETGKKTPHWNKMLSPLAEAYGINALGFISEMLSPSDETDVLIMKEDTPLISIKPEDDWRYEVPEGIKLRDASMRFCFVILPPNGKSDKFMEHPGEEILVVLEGELLCHVGQETYYLKSGELIHFKSELAHFAENKSGETAKILVVKFPA